MPLIRWLMGFVDTTRPECSSTRLAGLSAAFGGVVFAYVHPGESASTAALLAGAFSFFYGRDKAEKAAPKVEAKTDG